MRTGDPLDDFRNRWIVEMEVDRAFVRDAPNAIDEWQGIRRIPQRRRAHVLPITSIRNRSEKPVLRPYIYVDDVTRTMDPFTVAIVLIIIGAALLIVEAFSPGAFMVIPGTVLVILGLVGAAYPDILYSWWSPVIALVVAVPVTLLTVKGYQRLAKPEPPTTTVASSLVGREGTVIVSTETGSMKGKVKIGSDTWSATSDEPIEAGAKVVVENGEGVHVHVRRLRTR